MTPEQEARRARLLAMLAGPPPPAPSSMTLPGFEAMPATETPDGRFVVGGTPEPDIRMGGAALMPQTPDEEQAIRSDLDQPGLGLLLALSGLPTLRDAGSNLHTAVEQGDPVRGAAAVGEAGLLALPLTRLGRAMFSTLPRGIGTGLGTALVTETAAGRGPLGAGEAEAQTKTKGGREPPSEPVRRLQQQLKDAGFYSGEIDGIMGEGTKAAKAAFDAAETRKGAADTERLKAQAEAKKAEAEAKEAETRAAESAGKAKTREEGDRRLREMEGDWTTQALNWGSTLAPWLGAGLGGVLGHRLQGALHRRARGVSQAAADRADALMAAPMGNTNVAGRVGRVNQYWSEGHPSRAEPFRLAPRATGRHPYAVNAAGDVPTAGQLYQSDPSALGRVAQAAPLAAIGGAEAGVAHYGLVEPARTELAAAQKALDEDRSEANIQRLQRARTMLAVATLTERLGLGVALGAAGTEAWDSRTGAPMPRPGSLPQAERERGLLAALLGRPAPKSRRRRTP
jgi:hypothetical protein